MARQDQGRVHRRSRGHLAATAAGVLVIAMALTACGSGTKGKPAATSPTTKPGVTLPVVKKLGPGVTANSIKLGVALVDFKDIEQYTDTIRTTAEEKQIYQLYIDNINKQGGINGRKIVPDYKFYSPLGNAQILTDCTAFAQDDNVFAVVGTFIDFSGDAQTCVANQQHRVLMSFNLTQAIIDRSPPGLIVTAGAIPERTASIMIQLLKKENTLKGKTVAVLGDTTESSVVNKTIIPGLTKAGITLKDNAILSVGTTGDTTAAQTQLDSFIEKWKTDGVNTLFLSGDLASTKQFVQKIKAQIPNMMLLADNTDVLDQARQLQQAHTNPNPYTDIISAGGLSPKEYDASANWKYCADIYQKATGKPAENAEQTKKTADGKTDDTYGTINDACQTLTMFTDIARKVGPWLNNQNWTTTVDNFGPIENRGSGPYSSLHSGKYSADDNWRLQKYDPTLGTTGNWTPVTKLEDISG